MRHGIAAHETDRTRYYFGWPSVAVTESGLVAAVSSGLRRLHIDPWGKTALHLSRDGGDTWEKSRVIHDSPLDDRDAGIVSLGGEKLLVTWFTVAENQYLDYMKERLPEAEYRQAKAVMDAYTPDLIEKYKGSWTMRSEDGGKTWTEPARCPVNTPHGPIRLKDGRLFYLGKGFDESMASVAGKIMAYESRDEGESWQYVGTVPEGDGLPYANMHEPHAAVWEDGFCLGVIRSHMPGGEVTYATRSFDGGRTWTKPEPMGIDCIPTHLCRHSSGALIATYGWRYEPYGERAKVSWDRGSTWSREIVLRDDGPTGDLGYPCTAELPDGSLITVYYQALTGEDHTSVLYTKWTLDEVKA